jgi:hypothetical protein
LFDFFERSRETVMEIMLCNIIGQYKEEINLRIGKNDLFYKTKKYSWLRGALYPTSRDQLNDKIVRIELEIYFSLNLLYKQWRHLLTPRLE